MITNKLYLKDTYVSKTKARIVDIHCNEILLDQTVFYAERGGQVSDIGKINDLKVIDVQHKITIETTILSHPDFPIINLNTNVIHTVNGDLSSLKVGDEVQLEIDWERRKRIMQLHSAAHIVLTFANKVAGQKQLKGCLIQPEKSRLDFSSKFTTDKILKIEELSNKFIDKELDIKNEPLNDHPEALYWICDEIKIPCGGTHVKNTREIGHLSLKRRSQGKKVDRIYIQLK